MDKSGNRFAVSWLGGRDSNTAWGFAAVPPWRVVCVVWSVAKESIGKAPIGRPRDVGMGNSRNNTFGSLVYL